MRAHADGDGMDDTWEERFGLDPGDGGDGADDLDGDGLTNDEEVALGTDPNLADTDGDGIPDGVETNGGVFVDTDEDLVPDALDTDADGDGVLDVNEGQIDSDDDGTPNWRDTDDDGDGILTRTEHVDDGGVFGQDLDRDNIPNWLDLDSDGDGALDTDEGTGDADGDGIPNYLDVDDTDGPDADPDMDGLTNAQELVAGSNPNLADSDGDGILDPVDDCPDEPETYNGKDDEDGCPDGKQTVVITKSEIKILKRVYFATNKDIIKRRSYDILDTVAIVLRQNPQVKLVRIGGHTDDMGKDDYNLDLSQRRADAVRDYLIRAGVDSSRLSTKGFGEDEPLCKDIPEKMLGKRSRKLKSCRAENRRVEFKIIEFEGADTVSDTE